MRGLAALLVLLEHWRNTFFVDYPNLPAHKLRFALPYVLSSAGHQAVIIFFVLSGYLISASVFRLIDRGQWSWITYLIHRLMRLWVVLIPGLLLCALWDTIGLHFHLAPALYGGAMYNHMTPDVAQVRTLKIFFQNVFFLQGITAPNFGSDGALWSLANEFWYYILFPLGLLVVYRPRKSGVTVPARILSAIAFLVIAWLLPIPVMHGFGIWLAGTLLCLMPRLKLHPSARYLAAAIYIPIFFTLAKTTRLTGFQNENLLAVFTFLLLWVLISATEPVRHSPAERLTRELARFSYTLYVVHMPILILLAALTAGETRWIPTLPHILSSLAILAFTLLYAYAVAHLTEFRTDTWRRRLEAALGLNATRDTSKAVSRI
jgi:peptidoglycan/LPS O-acetylase OafA/YrhL